jgi:hypothetical protein
MKYPVYYSERKFKRTINKNSTFILIGNNIDGMVDFRFREFKNFKELSDQLLGILSNLKCCGEWDINLYQVKAPYNIWRKYGYYKYPSNGKLIFTHSYMNCPIKEIKFTDNEIIFIGSLLDVTENWHNPNLDFHQYDLSIEVIKIKIE